QLCFLAPTVQRNGKAVGVAKKVLKSSCKNILAHRVIFESSLRMGDVEGCEMSLRRMERCRSKITKSKCSVEEKRRALDQYLKVRAEVRAQQELQDTVKTIQECEKGLRLAPLDPDLLYYKLWALFEQDLYADLVDAYIAATLRVEQRSSESLMLLKNLKDLRREQEDLESNTTSI
ncbi:unnamed protein product, partial [Allacma fusca]